MRTKTKVLVGMIVLLVVALPLISGTLATEAYNERNREKSSARLDLQHGERLERFMTHLDHQHREGKVAEWFFGEAEAVTIEGIVVTHHRNILVIEAEEKRLNILLPPAWSVNSEVINVTEMFDENYVSIDDTVIIKALQREVTNKQGVTITIILAYEIRDTTSDTHLYAVLPFNISND